MAMNNIPYPVQCSDVPEGQAPEPYQTGIPVSPSANGDRGDSRGSSQPRPSDLMTDAERVDQSGRSHSQPSQSQSKGSDASARNSVPDEITIKGEKSIIIAKGLAGAMAKGTIFQLGSENHMNVYQNKGSSKNPESRPKIRNKRPITTSSAEPLPKQLDSICESLGRDWQRLGRFLDISDATLEQIRLDYHMEGQHEVNYRMLLRWKQNGGTSLHRLAQTLVDIGRGDLADLLAGN